MTEHYLGSFTATSADGRTFKILTYRRDSTGTRVPLTKVFKRPDGTPNRIGPGVFEWAEPQETIRAGSTDPLAE